MESVKNQDTGIEDPKPVLYVTNPSNPTLDTARGIILNAGNWDACEEITGQNDSDNWKGSEIVVYVDPNVTFGNRKVGGIRIRQARREAVQMPPSSQEEPPPPSAADVPF